jgi:hypothetical protein
MEPSFYHADEGDLPQWESEGISYRLIAGSIFGRRSPVPVYSPLYYLEMKSTQRQTVEIGKDLYGEAGLYILQGSIEIEGNSYQPKELLVAKDSKLCEFVMEADTTVYFFGGEPLPEPRFIYWNFVASDQELIDKAKASWLAQTFPKVPGKQSSSHYHQSVKSRLPFQYLVVLGAIGRVEALEDIDHFCLFSGICSGKNADKLIAFGLKE